MYGYMYKFRNEMYGCIYTRVCASRVASVPAVLAPQLDK